MVDDGVVVGLQGDSDPQKRVLPSDFDRKQNSWRVAGGSVKPSTPERSI